MGVRHFEEKPESFAIHFFFSTPVWPLRMQQEARMLGFEQRMAGVNFAA
jgi:hypothetical protein